MVDYLIIGAQKCGTSSLYKYLVQHPRILPASTKEVGFFDKSFDKGKGWYENQFRRGWLVRRLTFKIAGEATPEYLIDPAVPQRVFNLYPNMKLIAILRDPVERAYSHYQHSVRFDMQKLDFETALDIEPEVDDEGNDIGSPAGNAYCPRIFRYKSRGIYINQLARWHSVFPKGQLLILFFDELKNDPVGTTRKATEFLGLKPHGFNSKRIHNHGGEYQPMRPETRERLSDFFRPHNRRLSEYLGYELPWD